MPRAIEGPPLWLRAVRLGAVALLGAAALGISACASRQPAPEIAPQAIAPSAADLSQVADALQKLAHRDRVLDSVQSGAVFEYTTADRHVKAREQIVARRPDDLRVDAMQPFGVALIVVAHGPNLEIFQPSRNHVIRDAATADALNRYAQIPMEPADAVRLLMGLAPAGAPLAPASGSVAEEGAMTVASWRDSTSHQIGFQDGELAMVRQIGSDGGVTYEVHYSGYHDIGGLMFPYVVDADFPIAHSHLTLRYDRPIINGDVPDGTFVLSPQAAAKEPLKPDAAFALRAERCRAAKCA
ncbi:MAG TPA: hypothetical protein VEC38_15500 [Candidatus Binataceae bacterium]|nr:hypothetical protein [Candidatus Binataceae bacterium]